MSDGQGEEKVALTQRVAEQIVDEIHRHALEYLDPEDNRPSAVHHYPGFSVSFSSTESHPLHMLRWRYSSPSGGAGPDCEGVVGQVNAALLASDILRQKMRGLRHYPQIYLFDLHGIEWHLIWKFKKDMTASFQEEDKILLEELDTVFQTVDEMEHSEQWKQVAIPSSYPPENFLLTLQERFGRIPMACRNFFLSELHMEVDPDVPSMLRVRFQQ